MISLFSTLQMLLIVVTDHQEVVISYQQIMKQLLGGQDITVYLSGFVFALIGVAIRLLNNAKKRNKLSLHSPYQFSWKFLLINNLRDLSLGLLMGFIIFRFTNVFISVFVQYLVGFSLDGIDKMFYAFLVGTAFTTVSQWFKRLELNAGK